MSLGEYCQVLNIKKLTTIIFLTLVLSATYTFFNHTLAQNNIEQKNKAETLLTIIDNDNKTIRSAIDRLDAQNILVPQNVKTTYSEGIVHAKEAISLMNQGKFNQANTKAIEAMQKFEETLRLLDDASPSELTETEKIAEEAIALKANITRAFEYLERVKNLTARILFAGYNTSEVAERLTLVEQHLQNAKTKLSVANLEGATEELCMVQRLLGELKEDLARLLDIINASNTKMYLQEAEIRVSAAKTNITASLTLTPETKEDAITALNNSQTSLANARDSMENDNIDEAIKELEEAKKWEEESNRIITELDSTPTLVAPTYESIDKLETKTFASG